MHHYPLLCLDLKLPTSWTSSSLFFTANHLMCIDQWANKVRFWMRCYFLYTPNYIRLFWLLITSLVDIQNCLILEISSSLFLQSHSHQHYAAQVLVMMAPFCKKEKILLAWHSRPLLKDVISTFPWNFIFHSQVILISPTLYLPQRKRHILLKCLNFSNCDINLNKIKSLTFTWTAGNY